jgi:uncharacterized protein
MNKLSDFFIWNLESGIWNLESAIQRAYSEYMMEFSHTNPLINETSPYLLQHAHNPVKWYPWREEALSKAKREDKPILLSIGYSACHWCHVMEQESFENEEIAHLMNENYISIKVDREERPDLDAIYMTAVQLMTGRGGWPMTVFLTPDQVPFYGGTYFPPDDRQGLPGFRRILLNLAQIYREKRSIIHENAEALAAELRKANILKDASGGLDIEILDRAASALASQHDSHYGGFGQEPKFPPSMALSFLMQQYHRKNDQKFLEIINRTLEQMACGGIYDQIGGGFHRYSVDARWLVPHFEKMLYDNALLSRAYLDAFLLTGNDLYQRICRETLDYVAREMTSPEGGFYSSQDADSEGGEGAFFLWTKNEVQAVLGEEESALFFQYYGVTKDGNFEGKNILHVPQSLGAVARLNHVAEEQLFEIIRHGREILFDIREKRAKPGRDEKVLMAWNGLMLRSFAEASNVLDCERYRQIAVRNAEFLLSKLSRSGRLLRSYKDGNAQFNAYQEDYACLIDGLISLYEATFDLRWIREAEALANQMIPLFWDAQGGGFYFTSEDHESLIHRPKEFSDNAIPSGNSVVAGAFLKLWKLTGNSQWSRYAAAILESVAGLMPAHPSAFPHLLCALDFFLGTAKEIAIIGRPLDEGVKSLLAEVFHAYLPNKVLACGAQGGLFLLENKPQISGMATAYVCESFTCAVPVTSAVEFREKLGLESKSQIPDSRFPIPDP